MFRTRTLCLALLCLLHPSLCLGARLQVEVKGLESEQGQVIVQLFNSEESFLEEPLVEQILPASTQGVTFQFENLSEGFYALDAIHDLDSNGKMNTNFLGIPKEPVAVSNNAVGRFGPPSFEDAKFFLKESVMSLKINLKKID